MKYTTIQPRPLPELLLYVIQANGYTP